MIRPLRLRLAPIALGALCCHLPAWADDPLLPSVLIHSSRDSDLGLADSASAGSVRRSGALLPL